MVCSGHGEAGTCAVISCSAVTGDISVRLTPPPHPPPPSHTHTLEKKKIRKSSDFPEQLHGQRHTHTPDAPLEAESHGGQEECAE